MIGAGSQLELLIPGGWRAIDLRRCYSRLFVRGDSHTSRLNSGTSGIGALPFGAKFKLAPGPRPNSVDANWSSGSDRTLNFSIFFFFFPLLSNRAERDAPTKAAVQRRYWKSREYAMDIRRTYATVTRRERWLRVQHRRGVLDTSCLLGIVTFLTEYGNKEGSLGAAPPPRIAHHLGRTFTITRNGVGDWWGGGRSKSAFLGFFFTSPRRVDNPETAPDFSRDQDGGEGCTILDQSHLPIVHLHFNRKKVLFMSNISFCKYFLQIYNLTFW